MNNETRRTRIVATLGPATDAPGLLERALRAGVDVVRLNLSHGTPEDHLRRARDAHAVAAKLGREVGVLADLQGPKIRVEKFAHGPVQLEPGAAFTLDCRTDAPAGDASREVVSYLGLPRDVRAGDHLLLDDGLLELEVLSIDGPQIHCRVVIGGKLSDRKGLNRKGGGLSLDALSDKDRVDIQLAAQLQADFLAVSFVRSAADVTEARRLLRKAGGDAWLVAKIERAEAIGNLESIIDASDAVMVARGDLGVEVGDAALPGLQKKIIREALARNRVVITATQMLQSMVESPIPTRAEVLDVANAVIDGTDAVMLSAESAAGKHPDVAVAAMSRICLGAESQFEPVDDISVHTHRLDRGDQAVAMAAMFLATQLPVRAVVALTESGTTAQWLSRYRTSVPIYAVSRSAEARRRMLLLRDVKPMTFEVREAAYPAQVVREVLEQLFDRGELVTGDSVLVTHGDQTGRGGRTNTLKLLRMGADGIAESLRDF
jgi:pyruvate kinase